MGAGAAVAQTAPAAPSDSAAASAADTVNEVIVTGTRQTGIKAVDSPAPIQMVGGQQLKETGAVDLATSLAVAVPSFNTQANGGDAAAVHVLANLRGLSPDDTLVLVDGKRRHTTSNLAVDSGSVYSGSASVDLNYIPPDAIDHIEVLTDGASAQYGSDAIAGVVNIILKKNASGGYLTGTGGQFFNGQGATGQLAYHQGFSFAQDKGVFDMTLEVRTHDFTTLGTGDTRFQSANGQTLPSLTYPETNVTATRNYPAENRVNGDPEYAIYNSFFNGSYDLGDGIELYGFGNYSYNTSQHFENYRTPNKIVGTTTTGETVYPVPDGFDPKEQFNETDYSMTAGLRGTQLGWNWDLSTTYGSNSTQVNVLDTDNASWFATLQSASATPVSYPLHTIYDGSFAATEWTGSLDVDRSFAVGLAAPLNVAFGLEGRKDTYGIGAGEPESYYGTGAQSFAGYAPTDAGNYSRTNYAGYIDLATNPIKNLKVDVAGRYEHYSDFGDTKTGKVTLRYDFTDQIAIRGTISDGFRAPTLAEEYYSGLNVGPTSVSGQLPPNSAAAIAAGFQALRPEQSINYSVGIVAHPLDRLQLTVDAYDIILNDRILPSNSFSGLAAECVPNAYLNQVAAEPNPVTLTCGAGKTPEDVIVSQQILNAVTNKGISIAGLTNVGVAAFMNAVSTETTGVDMTGTYTTDFGEYGHVDWSVGFNYNHTYVTGVQALPSVVAVTNPVLVNQVGIQQTKFLNQISTSELTTAQPREKAILQAYWTKGKWSVNLRETIYSGMAEYAFYPTLNQNVLQTIGTTGITDLDVGYKLTSRIKIDVGANNLFNTLPPITPQGSTGQPITGSLVYNLPYGFAPWGENGGYYYGRVTFTF